MRVQQRKTKKTPTYRLEMMEPRKLLSAISDLSDTLVVKTPIVPKYPSVVVNGVAQPQSTPGPTGLIPAQMRGAYGVNQIRFSGANGSGGTFTNVVGDGTGQTIAIVDAYDYPSALTDLQAFDLRFGLPDPPSFQKLNEQGQATPLPGVDPTGAKGDDWETEESLDIEWAHVMAPNANIILFETNSPSLRDLLTGDLNAARQFGVSVISNSWGTPEFAGETNLDSTFATPGGHQGVTFVFAAGDSGAFAPGTQTIQTVWPAASPDVVAVGGTNLQVSGNTYDQETVWGDGDQSGIDGGGGGGVSIYETEQQYQKFLVPTSITTTNRAYPDVSMDADPATGVSIYNTYDFGNTNPWSVEGGTSLATPMFAGLVSIADQGRVLAGGTTLDGATQTLPRLYTMPYDDFNDVSAGSNGYQAFLGYDLGSGRGSPVASQLVPDLGFNYIGFHAFNDADVNGFQSPPEAGIQNAEVTLYNVGPDGVIGTGDDSIVATTTTDQYGLYEFSQIPTGTYYVHFVMPLSFTITPISNAGPATTNSAADPVTGNTGKIVVDPSTEYDLANVGAYQQTISINDVTITRPHTGTAPMVFTVTLAPTNLSTTAVAYTTIDGTATVANNDYIPTSGTLVFPPGTVQETITVQAVGNLIIENDVSFYVNTNIPVGFFPKKIQGIGTILNSNFPKATILPPDPQVRSSTIALNYPFTVSLSAPAPFAVSVPYTTQDISAIGGTDYVTASGTLVFAAFSITPQVVNVTVNPGTNRQLDKTFDVTLKLSPTIEMGSPFSATATILTNLPPALTAHVNPSVTESLTGVTYLPFVVEVQPSLSGPVSVSYTTADGTAVAGRDYKAVSGTLNFAPGNIIQTVYVPVFQQFIPQQDKTVNFVLSNPVGNILLVDPTNPSSNISLPTVSVTGTIHYLALAAIPFSARGRATYVDSLNQVVSISMRGPGEGDVVFLGSQSNDTNAYEVTVDGTTTATTVTVKVGGGKQTTLTDIIASSPLGSIQASTTNITSLISLADGLGSLNIGYVAGANINIGGSPAGPAVGLTFNRFVNGFITSASPIKFITAGAYLNTTGGEITITAPSVGPVKVKGNFGGTIVTTNLASLTVGGTIDGGGIIAGAKIGAVTAASIVNSTFYAGVNSDVLALPASNADFANTSSAIKSIKVKGGAFSNTLISGWSVGSVSSTAAIAAAGTVNISGNSIGKVQATTATSHKLVQVSDPTADTSVGNVVVDLVAR